MGRRKRISRQPEVPISNFDYNQVFGSLKVPTPGSRQSKKPKTTNEEFGYGSVSEDLSSYTARAEMLCKQVEQLLKSPSTLQKMPSKTPPILTQFSNLASIKSNEEIYSCRKNLFLNSFSSPSVTNCKSSYIGSLQKSGSTFSVEQPGSEQKESQNELKICGKTLMEETDSQKLKIVDKQETINVKIPKDICCIIEIEDEDEDECGKEQDLGYVADNPNPKLDKQGDCHMIPLPQCGVVEVVKDNQVELSKTFLGTLEKGEILEKVVEDMEKKLKVSHNAQLSLKHEEMGTKDDGKDDFGVAPEAAKGSEDTPIVILNCDVDELSEKKIEELEKPTACMNLDVANDSEMGFPRERNMQDDSGGEDDDGLSSLWTEMSLALRCSQVSLTQEMDSTSDKDDIQECMHSFIEQDDLGKVCILCGFIGQTIDTMFDIQWPKARKTTKYNRHVPKEMESILAIDNSQTVDCMASEQRSPVAKLVLHPSFKKRIKSHQIDGFEFLQKNLITEEPGGCILAHAPGTGKTFLVISFIQSFLAKYPDERPLIVAPKSILCSWMNEFKTWHVEEIPLLDLYEATNKAESLRSKQLQTLREWKEKKSILLVSYSQFSSIVCESADNQMTAWCQKLLLEGPGLLILDEGHFPRNKDTNILYALSQIHTRRRILLSGTLFQNNIKELFNLLRLIRPDILELVSFQTILSRLIQSISGSEMYQKLVYRRHSQDPLGRIFCEALDYALQSSSEEVKMSALQDLKELTSLFVHYYKGEILDDLPGLVDFTVKLNLNEKQKKAFSKAQNIVNRMSRDIMCSAVAIHPSLDGATVSGWLDSDNNNTGNTFTSIRADSKDGVKTKFVFDILSLCESTKEKLLVFSQYLPPLSLLENMLMTEKKWSKSREILRVDGSTPTEVRGKIIEQFNTGPDSKVLFASIKACGEGICLTGASRVIILDIPWNPSITRQAISRAFRIGQKRKVYAYRLVAAGTPEEEIQLASLKKELMSKMLFERSNQPEDPISLLEEEDQDDCEDMFFQSGSPLRENLSILYRQRLP